jgi:hypothetical protein
LVRTITRSLLLRATKAQDLPASLFRVLEQWFLQSRTSEKPCGLNSCTYIQKLS